MMNINLNILPKDKEKRIQFIFAIFCTLVVLGVVWLFLISPQYNGLHVIAQKENTARTRLKGVEDTIKNVNEVNVQLAQASNNLTHAEEDLATGDFYAWTYDTLRRFKANYRVDIPTISQPTMGEVDVVPQFPYKQIRVSVSGTAYYHDLGKFIADFENAFPHIRVVNLTIEPSTTAGPESEKLAFRMDIVALVKPNS